MKCQLLRPGCLNVGVDLHGAAIQWPFVPLKWGLYATVAKTEWITGDRQHGTVKQSGDGCIKLWHDCMLLRPHIPLVFPFPELLFWIVFSALGSSKACWGSFRTKHGGNFTAVVLLGNGSNVGVINQLNCGEPVPVPNVLSIQTPTTVFADVNLGDFLGCLAAIAVDVLIALLVRKVSSKLKKPGFTDKLGRRLASKFIQAPVVRNLVNRATDKEVTSITTRVLTQFAESPFRYSMAQKGVDRVMERFTNQLGDLLGQRVISGATVKGAKTVWSLFGNDMKGAVGLPNRAPGDPAQPNIMQRGYERIAQLVDGR